MNISLIDKLQALLHVTGGELSYAHAAEICEVKEEEIRTILPELSARYGGGVVAIVSDTDISVRVSPECSSFIDAYTKRSHASEIGPAALEVLSILLYRGSSTQADIDVIRGVHSSYTLRSLRARGLVERTNQGGRALYSVTSETLAHLGITSIDTLPDRDAIARQLAAFEERVSHSN